MWTDGPQDRRFGGRKSGREARPQSSGPGSPPCGSRNCQARSAPYGRGSIPPGGPPHGIGNRPSGSAPHGRGSIPPGSAPHGIGNRPSGSPSHGSGNRPSGRPPHGRGSIPSGSPSYRIGNRPSGRTPDGSGNCQTWTSPYGGRVCQTWSPSDGRESSQARSPLGGGTHVHKPIRGRGRRSEEKQSCQKRAEEPFPRECSPTQALCPDAAGSHRVLGVLHCGSCGGIYVSGESCVGSHAQQSAGVPSECG